MDDNYYDLSPDLETGIIAASFKEVGIRLEERECEKISSKQGQSLRHNLIRREIGMPSGPPAEFGESALIASIIIESEKVMSVRNKSSSRVVWERKKCYRVFNYRSLFRLGKHTVKLVYE